MKITQLYVYPVKSLRGIPVSSAKITGTGFQHDRRFMLLKVKEPASADGTTPRQLQNMHVSEFHEMSLFMTALRAGDSEEAEGEGGAQSQQHGEIIVTYKPVDTNLPSRTLEIPIRPDMSHLETLEVMMHFSPTKAYDMGEKYNTWFSTCFGYDVILAYLGPYTRRILGNVNPYPVVTESTYTKASRALSGLLSYLPNNPLTTHTNGNEKENDDEINESKLGGISFADCASYLIVTEESLANVSSRLPAGEEMDMTKFRPNIVLSGSPGGAWDEDYWAEVTILDPNHPQKPEKASLVLTANCARCQSINVDYATGKRGTGESGSVLKKLMKDRRVDGGVKYSPVFGRYGFAEDEGVGKVLCVGDEVEVGRRNGERTSFVWPGLTN